MRNAYRDWLVDAGKSLLQIATCLPPWWEGLRLLRRFVGAGRRTWWRLDAVGNKALNLVLKILKKPPNKNSLFCDPGQANRFDALEARNTGLDRDLSFKPATDVRSP